MTRTPKPTTSPGVKLSDAVKQTGLTVWQLRKLIKDGDVRLARASKFIEIHPEDVAKLAERAWMGQAYQPKKGEV